MNESAVKYLSFDCFGTLIDWETGILNALGPLCGDFADITQEDVLRFYAELEAEFESGEFCDYRQILNRIQDRMVAEFGTRSNRHTGQPGDPERLSNSVGTWKPFPDTIPTLEYLSQSFGLVILSNVDNDQIAQTTSTLGVSFRAVFTSQQIGSYKPAVRNFEYMLDRLNIEPSQIIHVAQSLYHDHVPARKLGLTTVWVDRPSRLKGQGVTPGSSAEYDYRVTSLAKIKRILRV